MEITPAVGNQPAAVDERQASDALGSLARRVARGVRLRASDRSTFDDCFQEAFENGWRSVLAATAAGKPTSRRILEARMRQAIYRLLHKGRKEALRECDCVCSV